MESDSTKRCLLYNKDVKQERQTQGGNKHDERNRKSNL